MDDQTTIQKPSSAQGFGWAQQTPRDVFMYLLNVIVLGMAAVNLGILLFQLINVYIPDVLTDRYSYPDAYSGAIRWAVATLVIVFPVFVWVTRFLNRDIAVSPEKKDLKIRKWLLYLTLFVAGLVIIGDSIALVYSFLEGEVTLRFFLKVLVILAISGTTFFYYLNILRDQRQAILAVLSKLVIFLVAVTVAVGIFVAGLPQNRRIQRIDEQRVYDLQNIQGQVVSYWQLKRSLPASLADLRKDVNGFTAPTDPESGEAYGYTVLGALQFKLCATFKADSPVLSGEGESRAYPVGGMGENWEHGVGTVCFERTIDPSLYPLNGKPVPIISQ